MTLERLKYLIAESIQTMGRPPATIYLTVPSAVELCRECANEHTSAFSIFECLKENGFMIDGVIVELQSPFNINPMGML